jgi:hypothetical protein
MRIVFTLRVALVFVVSLSIFGLKAQTTIAFQGGEGLQQTIGAFKRSRTQVGRFLRVSWLRIRGLAHLRSEQAEEIPQVAQVVQTASREVDPQDARCMEIPFSLTQLTLLAWTMCN